MIPDSRLSAEVNIEPEVAEILVNKHEIYTCIVYSALYTDIDKKMKGAGIQTGIQIECSNGLVENNVLDLEENRKYYLNQIRCTEAYQRKLIIENLAKQDFNGKQNLDVAEPIPCLPAGLSTFF
jgi:hypothetical protein